jgi:hypothetical protein
MLSGVQPGVMTMLTRSGLDKLIGDENFFWSADQAIVAAEERLPCPYCESTAIPASNLFYSSSGAVV